MSRDESRLLDIFLAARKVQAFCEGAGREAFEADELLQNAALRLLQVIGEASRNISRETRDAHPEIPWREMISFRHKLVHEYFRVDIDEVWGIIHRDVPRLIALIAPLVPPEEG
mgnify:CR=1 FL=1